MTTQQITRAAVCAGVLLAGAINARAECSTRTYCELVNQPGTRIFMARALHPIDGFFSSRVHVTRNFLGATKGDVDVHVNSGEYLGTQSLEPDTEYLLIVHMEEMPGYRRILTTGGGCSPPALEWKDVTASDRVYLEGLSRPQRDGRIYGDIIESQRTFQAAGRWSFATPVAATGVRLFGRGQAPLAVTTTDHEGHFEFRGLAAGRYRVMVDLSPSEFELEQADDRNNVTLLRHGCEDRLLSVKRR